MFLLWLTILVSTDILNIFPMLFNQLLSGNQSEEKLIASDFLSYSENIGSFRQQ